jgi:anti-sigma regulatory factor (Ser/Thr protein kinase)
MQMFKHERRASFPLTDVAPYSARHWFTDEGFFPSRIRDDVVLLLSELVANSVSHSGLAAPEEVEVSVRVTRGGGVHVEVVDQGIGIEEPLPPAEPDRFGLRFVDQVTDRWGYTNDPTRVWFDISSGM